MSGLKKKLKKKKNSLCSVCVVHYVGNTCIGLRRSVTQLQLWTGKRSGVSAHARMAVLLSAFPVDALLTRSHGAAQSGYRCFIYHSDVQILDIIIVK